MEKKKFTHLTFKTRYKSSLIHQAAHITMRVSTFGLGSTQRTTCNNFGIKVLNWPNKNCLQGLKNPLRRNGYWSPRRNAEMKGIHAELSRVYKNLSWNCSTPWMVWLTSDICDCKQQFYTFLAAPGLLFAGVKQNILIEILLHRAAPSLFGR